VPVYFLLSCASVWEPCVSWRRWWRERVQVQWEVVCVCNNTIFSQLAVPDDDILAEEGAGAVPTILLLYYPFEEEVRCTLMMMLHFYFFLLHLLLTEWLKGVFMNPSHLQIKSSWVSSLFKTLSISLSDTIPLHSTLTSHVPCSSKKIKWTTITKPPPKTKGRKVHPLCLHLCLPFLYASAAVT